MRSVNVAVVIAFMLMIGSTLLAAGPRVEKVSPGLGQRGTSFDLRLEGGGFTEGSNLLFYRPGLVCTNVKVESDSVLILSMQTAADCPLGNHPFRVRSNQGLSELTTARIMPLPLVNEVEPNNSLATAQVVSLGSSTVGVLASGDVDNFKVSLKKGQRLSAEIEGVRLASALTDLKLLVFRSDGTPLASADDTALGKQDPYLTVVASADGDYVVQVDTSGLEGSDNARYVLHLGHCPRPDYVFPAGGRVGQPTTVRVRGDATVEWDETVTFNDVGTQDFYPTYEGLNPPTPISFRVSAFDNLLEAEPNNAPADLRSSASTLPIALNGVISEPGDKDLYRFQAEAGATVEFSVFAAQLGSLADTVIRILSADGTVLTSRDDGVGLDSKLVWPCSATGEYLLQVTEKRRAGGNRYFYRVEAKTVEPTVVAFLPRRDHRGQVGQTISVPQGNRVLGFVAVKRQRWTGDAEIDFPKLPAGIAKQYGRISADEYLMPFIFEAASDAPIAAELVPVLARSYSQSPTILGEFEQPVDLVAASADRLYQGVTVNTLAVAVVDPAPFRIQFEEPPTALPSDGSLELIVRVDRDEGFQGAVDVTIPFLPAWVDGPEKITVAAEQSQAKFALRHPEVNKCTWPTVAEGRSAPESRPSPANGANAAAGQGRPVRGGRRRPNTAGHEVASQLLPLVIADSPLTGEIGQQVATPGQTIQVKIPLKNTGSLPEKLTASMKGLPSRVQADDVPFFATDSQVVFNVQFADDAPLGSFSGLICEFTGEWNGALVTYRVGRGGAIKIVRPGELVVDESGRPLSPLELLRKKPLADEETSAKADTD